jgi:hypothetical protein
MTHFSFAWDGFDQFDSMRLKDLLGCIISKDVSRVVQGWFKDSLKKSSSTHSQTK